MVTALNMNDPYIVSERTPPEMAKLGTRLATAYDVGNSSWGCKGNEYHRSGFHRSRNYCENSPQSPYGGNDYSCRGIRNQGGRGDNCGGFDFTPGVWGSSDNISKMKVITKRLHDAAVANDPRLGDWYEFAGTFDGVNVVTFYAHGGGFKDPFDSSHLNHLHGSKYRDALDKDNTGVGDVILGIPLKKEEEDDMGGYANIKINDFNDDDQARTNIGVPGGLNRKPTWLVITNDTSFGAANGPDYALRIAAKPYGGGWTLLGTYGSPSGNGPVGGMLSPSGIVQLKNGETMSWKLPDDTRVVSVVRVATPTDNLAPIYDGPLGATLEV